MWLFSFAFVQKFLCYAQRPLKRTVKMLPQKILENFLHCFLFIFVFIFSGKGLSNIPSRYYHQTYPSLKISFRYSHHTNWKQTTFRKKLFFISVIEKFCASAQQLAFFIGFENNVLSFEQKFLFFKFIYGEISQGQQSFPIWFNALLIIKLIIFCITLN